MQEVVFMPENIYESMYAVLCVACDRAIETADDDSMPDALKLITIQHDLNAALLTAEEMYIENEG